MSSALNYALSRLCGRGAIDIPKQIIQVAFRDEWLDRSAPISLENKILNWVIKPRVIEDMGLVHGEEILVDLSLVDTYTADQYARIYNIPPRLTNNREIMSVISVSYVPFGQIAGHAGGTSMAMVPMMSNDLMTAGSQVMSSVGSIPSTSSSRVDLVGHNVVRVTDRQRLQAAYILRCYVANDGYLNNLSPRTYPAFTKMCILAVKAYIYNEMIITMGDHQLQRGQELSVFKDIVLGWAECAQEYHDYLKNEWAVVAYTMDEDAYTRFLQYQIPSGL